MKLKTLLLALFASVLLGACDVSSTTTPPAGATPAQAATQAPASDTVNQPQPAIGDYPPVEAPVVPTIDPASYPAPDAPVATPAEPASYPAP